MKIKKRPCATAMTGEGEDEYDSFPCPFLRRTGVYPLTPRNRDLVERRISKMPTYKSDLKNIASNWDDEANYKKGLTEAVRDINKTNKTFLNKGEIDTISLRVLNLCESKEELVSLLNSCEGTESIFKTVADKNNNGYSLGKYHVSFASKFIVCISSVFGAEAHKNFAKYDSVVSSRLPAYLCIYGLANCDESDVTFEIECGSNLEKRLNVYKHYNVAIRNLLEKINGKVRLEKQLTLEELDHLIWFFGRKASA